MYFRGLVLIMLVCMYALYCRLSKSLYLKRFTAAGQRLCSVPSGTGLMGLCWLTDITIRQHIHLYAQVLVTVVKTGRYSFKIMTTMAGLGERQRRSEGERTKRVLTLIRTTSRRREAQEEEEWRDGNERQEEMRSHYKGV